jgi:SAM-dependent methyltransferase
MVGSWLRHQVRRGIRLASAVVYAGDQVYCPCCERSLRRFLRSPYGPSLACPACGSLERQRLLMLYLAAHTDVLESPVRMLHFAPEPCLYYRFTAAPQLDYVTADLDDAMPMIDVRADITVLDFSDDSFDVVLCSHVLEHVDDDAQALRELRRVVRPTGRVFLQHPIDPARERTYEDWTMVEPGDRSRAFGQRDHVRVYGQDFVERVRAAGLTVEFVPYLDQVPPDQVRRFALRDGSSLRGSDLYICSPQEQALPATDAMAEKA